MPHEHLNLLFLCWYRQPSAVAAGVVNTAQTLTPLHASLHRRRCLRTTCLPVLVLDNVHETFQMLPAPLRFAISSTSPATLLILPFLPTLLAWCCSC